MRRSSGWRGCLLGVVFCVGLVSYAYAQDTYRLADKSATGDVAQVEEGMSMDITMKAAAAGTPVRTFHSSMQETKKFLQSILSKNSNGKMDGLRRSYTVAREVKKDPTGEKITTSPLQGRTVTIQRKGKEVVVTSTTGTLPQDVRRSLQDVFDDEFDLAPDHAVAVGEEWEVDPKKIAHSSSFKDVKNAKVQVKLLDIVSFEGHRCARMRVTMHVELPIGEAASMQINVSGDGYLALDIERLLGMDLRGPVQFVGNILGEGAEASGEGTAHLKLTLHWEKVAGKPITAGKL